MRFPRWSGAAIAAAVIGTLPIAIAAQNIDTRNVDSYVYGGSGIYGQSFTVGTTATLLSYAFWVGANDPANGGVGRYDFLSQLFAWNGTGIVGGPLYTSATFDSGCCDDLVPPRYDFNVGALSLTSGAQCVATIARTTTGGLELGYVRGPSSFIDSYAGGEFVGGVSFGGGAPDAANATYLPIAFAPGNDLMFAADFAQTAAPEPAMIALLATGIGLLGVVRRRRRAA
jgi:hypothetical protein